MTEEQQQTVEVSDRETTINHLIQALGVLQTGRKNGAEAIGLPVMIRRAAAEGLAELGFRYIEALATKRVVPPKDSWLGAHALGHTESVDPAKAEAAMREFAPEIARRFDEADTDEKRAALRAELEPRVRDTLRKAGQLDDAVDVIRTQERHDAGVREERKQAKERGEQWH